MSEPIRTYAEFWPFYLGEHSHPKCRQLHFVGTTIAAGLLAASLATMNPWLLISAPLVGYGFAWTAHFGVEKNRPATFKYPLWSFLSDFRMWGAMATGKLWRGHNPAEQVDARH